MKRLGVAALAAMMTSTVVPAAADAATFQYAFTVETLTFGGNPTGEFYSAKGVLDAQSQGVNGDVEQLEITNARGAITSGYDGTVWKTEFVGPFFNTPAAILTLANGQVTGASFAVFGDNAIGFRTGIGLNDGEAFFSEVGARIVSGSITAVAGVPEPAAWAMMIGGFGMAGAALRRRRSVSVRFA